jgi:DNA polymerase III subunit delta
MTPEQFFSRIGKGNIAAAYLLLGPETYSRDRCRGALLDAMLTPEEREQGLAQYDLRESALADVVEDARSLSLFAARRVIVVANAELALPRQKAGEEVEDSGAAATGGAQSLEEYMKDPTPGVVLLLEAVRFEFEGEEKKRLERTREFYSCVKESVELRRYPVDEARAEARELAKRAGLQIDRDALELLVEALGAGVARIAVEIEKLSLYAGPGRAITLDDISALVPDARATTIFALVNALGRRDRRRSLQILDTLTRDGEYLPLALAFLSTQFRMALVSKETGLRSAQQIQGHFSRLGVPVWGARAEQIYQTVGKFSKEQLELGLKLIFRADRDMRSARPDDRIVMEKFIFELTRPGAL